MRYLTPLAIACLALPAPEAVAVWTIEFKNTALIDSSVTPGLTELSGVAYESDLGSGDHQLRAVQDSGDQLVTLNVALNTDGSLSSATATATQTLSPGGDFEGLALGPAGGVLVTDESTNAVTPYSLATGVAGTPLALPPVFGSSAANRSLESLARDPDGATFWVANEEALTPDGVRADTTSGTTVRLQSFSIDPQGAAHLGPQYAYPVDPIHAGTTTDNRTRSGLVDLVILPGGTLIALERSLGNAPFIGALTIPQYESKIYQVDYAAATDTSQGVLGVGLLGQDFTPATKTLLWNGSTGNLEGLTLGPRLAGGAYSLLGVIDDGGGNDPFSSNSVVAFVATPNFAAGDFNFDDHVNAADYTVWRDGLGTHYTVQDYTAWRSSFSQQSAAASTRVAAVTPEPAAIALVVVALAGVARHRSR